MTCDLHSDPQILLTYSRILQGEDVDWMILGYKENSRDILELVASGSGGVEGVKKNLFDDVVYVVVQLAEGRTTLIHYVPQHVAGVKRARALVHGRQVSSILKCAATISFQTSSEFNLENVRARLGLDYSESDSGSPATSPVEEYPDQIKHQESRPSLLENVQESADPEQTVLSSSSRFAPSLDMESPVPDDVSTTAQPRSSRPSTVANISRRGTVTKDTPSSPLERKMSRLETASPVPLSHPNRRPSTASVSTIDDDRKKRWREDRETKDRREADDIKRQSERLSQRKEEDRAHKEEIKRALPSKGVVSEDFFHHMAPGSRFWKRRFCSFVIGDGAAMVHLYKDTPCPKITTIASIKLKENIVTDVSEECGLPYMLKVVSEDREEHLFRAENKKGFLVAWEAFEKLGKS